MKKTTRLVAVSAAILTAVSFASCGSSKVEDKRNDVPEAAASEIDKVVVVDWTDRALGEVSAPTWLKNMRRGNSDTFKQSWGVDANRVVKVSMATGKTEATAQALSRAGFAYTQAAELNQKVIGRVGQGLNDIGQLEALYLAASETKADMTGLREETGFFQKVRTTNADTGAKSEQFVYYTVYSMSKETWDALCKKYLIDMMGGADLTTETQKKIGALFSEMKEDADKKDAQKQADEEMAYKAQIARLEAERAKSNAAAAASNAETAKAGLRAKEMDAQEAQTKKAAEEAEELASYLMCFRHLQIGCSVRKESPSSQFRLFINSAQKQKGTGPCKNIFAWVRCLFVKEWQGGRGKCLAFFI